MSFGVKAPYFVLPNPPTKQTDEFLFSSEKFSQRIVIKINTSKSIRSKNTVYHIEFNIISEDLVTFKLISTESVE